MCGVLTANVSVLRWWFGDKSSRLVLTETLQVELTLASDHRYWEIRISGFGSFSVGILTGWFRVALVTALATAPKLSYVDPG